MRCQNSKPYIQAKLNASGQIETIVNPEDVKMKLVCIEHKNQLYFIPLLHTV